MSAPELPVITQRDGVTLVSITNAHGSLDTVHIKQLTGPLLRVAETAEPPIVVLDLSETTRFGTAFLASLVRMWKRLASRDGRLALAGLTPHCLEIIETTHLNEIWEIFETTDDAIRSMA